MSTAFLTDSPSTDQLRSFARSIGQILLQRNAATGVLIFAAVCAFSTRLACALVIGALTGGIVAYIVEDADSPTMRDDLYGFNGALAALAAFTFIRDDSQAGAVAIVSAMLATALSFRLGNLLRRFRLPVYSSPAIIVTWCWLPLFADATSSGASASASTASTTTAWLEATLAGFAPIVFTSGVLAGTLLLVSLCAARPAHAAWAIAGSTVGLSLHALAGAPDAMLLSGACGFNATLTALATSKYGVRATLAGIVVAVLIERAAASLGIISLTAPFVLATWAVQATIQRTDVTANHGDSHVVHPSA
jgi:urea transporter